MKCVFCRNEFDQESNTPEHILLNALGGRLTSRKVDCADCNNRFGAGIDNSMANSVAEFRCIGGLRSGDRKLPPPIMDIKLKNGQCIDLLPGMIPRDRNVVFERNRLENGNLEVKFGAGSFRKIANMLPNIAKGSGLTLDQLVSTIRGIDIQIQKQAIAEFIPFKLSLGGLDPNRSMAKSLIVLWCHHFGCDEFTKGDFSGIVKFVNDDAFAKVNDFASIDSRPLTLSSDVLRKQDFGTCFTFLHVRSDSSGGLKGIFRLYNLCSWIFSFDFVPARPDANVTLISNPFEPGNWEVFLDTDIGLDQNFMESKTNDPTVVQESIKTFMNCATERNQDQAQINMIEESMRDYFPHDGKVITENHIYLLSKEIAEDFVAMHFNLDRTKVISGERAVEILTLFSDREK
ncbi:MAG: HNH endonuclease [Oligoflexales bacterium]